ncbi:MAG: M42 family metallopeptidase [Planctomycetaceae bacterium]|nr:M42 family metallopeptidase [Planctomycetaceae bacterium]MBQ2820431.1 M42 family metallopeptidase [Thermoguttaceae bacterium]MDO4425165.1 M42 family metallopeptidase [Planctomycetia bacterium]
MDTKSKEFLKKVLLTPSPTGFEQPVQELVREYARDFAEFVETDVMGNVIAGRNVDAPIRVMLSGHCDQIGLSVQFIDDNGYLYVIPLGGWDVQNLIGQHVTVWTKNGAVPGVIGKKPIHLLDAEERKAVPKMSDIWVDIGAKDKAEASEAVRVGDAITVQMTYSELKNDLIAASATDDKAGMWVVMEALRRIDGSKLKVAAYAVSSTQEEVGLRGATTAAFRLDPHVGIAVDVTFTSDCPTIDSKKIGDIRVNKGPAIGRGPNFNPAVVEKLVQIGDEQNIPYQLNPSGSPPGTDARAIQMTRSGVATGLVSIPNRYMHSPVEVVSLADMDACADLLARFIESLDENSDFIPKASDH